MQGENVEQEALLSYYRAVLRRYADEISLSETKTVPQLKELVVPDDDSVISLKERLIAESKISYEYPDDFLSFVALARNRIASIRNIQSDLGISFWLSPSEILEMNACDIFDKAILLCSLLISAGNSEVKVTVVELSAGLLFPLVEFSFSGQQYAVDPVENRLFDFSSRQDFLSSFVSSDRPFKRLLYSFNDRYFEEY